MAPILSEESPDCTERCRSLQHGDIITAAISRRSVSDLALCSYLNHICNACESVRDSAGRTALHVAASCGRIGLVKWLIQCRHANINAKDEESGFTALHRSIFYGRINVAVELIKLGANIALLDANNLTVLEHAMKDGFKPDSALYGELYVWGSNSSNCLGPQQARTMPELMDVFHKKFPNEQVAQICIEKFHSVIVSGTGSVYSCGHGQGGRLGLGTQQTVVSPEPVTFPETNGVEEVVCVQAAVGKDHTVFLCTDGSVYSCGLNTHRVLGLNPAPAQILIPTQVRRFRDGINGVCVGQFHSVVWDAHFLYSWGLNAGQLGHKLRNDDKYVTSPKLVRMLNTAEMKIRNVDSSDGAIAIYTDKGDIYVLHEYQCKRIASRQLNLVQISVFGGKLNLSISKELSNDSSKDLKVAALTNTGNLLLWQESDPQLCRCIFSLNRAIIIQQIALNANGLLFVSRDGEAFQGFIRLRKKKTANNQGGNEKSAFHKFLEREDCIPVKISKFPRIHRAISIKSDSKGNDFCVIQALPYKRFEFSDLKESDLVERFSNLLQDCHENDDIHDVVFKVDTKYFPAHRFIVASKSPYLEKLLIDCEDVVELDGCNPIIFEQFLLYCYSGSCDLLKCGEISEKLKNLSHNNDKNIEDFDEDKSAFEIYKSKSKNKGQDKIESGKMKNGLRLFQEMAKKFCCSELSGVLNNLEMHKSMIRHKSGKEIRLKALRFSSKDLPAFSDVTIRCLDGKEVQAHKCILAARNDYFSSLFSVRWQGSETSVITLPCTKTVTEALLEFLYTDSLSETYSRDQDYLYKLLILADQLFISHLKETCEFYLTNCLHLKNAIQFLTFAHIYNAEKLKQCCMKFIIDNITPLLELRQFDEMNETLLKQLTDFYIEQKRDIDCRVITPYSTAPTEEEIVSVSASFPVCLDEEVVAKVVTTATTKSNAKRRSRPHRPTIFNQKLLSPKEELICARNIEMETEEIVIVGDSGENPIASRLKAIKLAEAKLARDEIEENFTQLKAAANYSRDCEILGSSFEDFPLLNSPPGASKLRGETTIKSNSSDILGSSFEDFPLLNSPPTSSYASKPHKNDGKHKIVRLSQKQRKRLSSESNVEVAIPESPKNPWKIMPEIGSPSSLENSMSEIISSEKKQRDNLIKIKSKSLIYTQMEDKAIDELYRFYNCANIMDEDIKVARVDMGAVAIPVWVPGNKRMEPF